MKTERIKPPANMTNREKVLFRKLVAPLPPDFYIEADRCLLISFVCTFFDVQDARLRLRTEGPRIPGVKGLVVNPDIKIIRDGTLLMSSIGTKLRLIANARTIKDKVQPALARVANQKVYNPVISPNNSLSPNPDWQKNQRDVDLDS